MSLKHESGGALRWILRGLAVVVAVVIGVFLVRDNHRRAQPAPEAVPPAQPATAPPPAEAPNREPRQAEAPSARGPAEAEPTPPRAEPTPPRAEPVFFHTSKAMAPPIIPDPPDATP